MPNIIEAGVSAGIAVTEYVGVRLQGEKLSYTPQILSIYAGLRYAFPETFSRLSAQSAFRSLATSLPVFIAVNDFCDLGITARLKITNGCAQHQFVPLKTLENTLQQQVNERIDALPDNSLKRLIGIFRHDAELLSLSRGHYGSEKQTEYVETEMGIYETACIAVTRPGILEACAINYFTYPENIDQLAKKYLFFSKRQFSNRQAAKMLGLHAISMIRKIGDDKQGKYEDAILGITNIADQDRNEYFALAHRVGFPYLAILGGALVQWLDNQQKNYRVHHNIQSMEYDRIYREITTWKQNTRFRSALASSGMLDEIFRQR